MGKWIDADALKQQVESPYTEYPIMIQIRKALKDFIDEAPTIEPKQGEWIYTDNPLRLDDEWACSRCGNISFARTNFCDRCGARMKGTNDETD